MLKDQMFSRPLVALVGWEFFAGSTVGVDARVVQTIRANTSSYYGELSWMFLREEADGSDALIRAVIDFGFPLRQVVSVKDADQLTNAIFLADIVFAPSITEKSSSCMSNDRRVFNQISRNEFFGGMETLRVSQEALNVQNLRKVIYG